MSGTYAIDAASILYQPEDLPLCPACHGGRLHPYRIEVNFMPHHGVNAVVAWVLQCIGGSGITPEPVEPCGFAVAGQPQMFGKPITS